MKVLLFFMFAMLSPPALAQDNPEQKPAEDKKICRMVEQTGSILLRKKYCLTRAEWAKLNQVTGDRAARAMDQRTLGPNSSFNKD
jgi:hypothetical protein